MSLHSDSDTSAVWDVRPEQTEENWKFYDVYIPVNFAITANIWIPSLVFTKDNKLLKVQEANVLAQS